MVELTSTEKKIIALLKKGQQQAEIAEYFRNNERFNINSQSAVEKVIMGLKKKFGVKTIFQLGVAICKVEN
ncbi:hypothetical protein BHF72_2452 [Cloacibacterium normanense]|uniref:HTH luxR-type domain-containing protein n=2 Tax=Cloacibacterium normanense TaxID=237258 RepID=A0A1E5UE56_9FLAO|nr:hypothetical protein BHF72_2452 [Cloacibacterium normanense]SDO87527.1 hypothetical protein SAMN04489756_12415 [Cloacibacterium normanense]